MLPRKIMAVAASSRRPVSPALTTTALARMQLLRRMPVPGRTHRNASLSCVLALPARMFASSPSTDHGEQSGDGNNARESVFATSSQQDQQQEEQKQPQQQPQQENPRSKGDLPTGKKPSPRQPPRERQDRTKGGGHNNNNNRTPSRLESTKKKWRAPFWLPPPHTKQRNPSSPASDSQQQQQPHHRNHRRPNNNNNNKRAGKAPLPHNRFKDAFLPCRKHLDPTGRDPGLPTSDWVSIFGALPTTSMEEVVDSIENLLRHELDRHNGTIDLDAEWNPHHESGRSGPPLVPAVVDCPIDDTPEKHRSEYALDEEDPNGTNRDNSDETDGTTQQQQQQQQQMESFRVVKAHVVLSPYGRPTGWNLRLANPSMVHLLLKTASNAKVRGSLRIGWKFAKVKEHHHPAPNENKDNSFDSGDTRTMLVVSDSMVRFENCPPTITKDYLRHMLSRYELTQKGATILRWKGKTHDGLDPPPTFVVRFASPAYARAAIRELQGDLLEGKPMKLIQYPRQLL